MNKPLETLFEDFYEHRSQVPEYGKNYDMLCKPVTSFRFKTPEEVVEEEAEKFSALSEIAEVASRQAFEADFNTALALMGGVQ